MLETASPEIKAESKREMKKILLFVFLTTMCFGQVPRPYIAGGLSLMPAGYASAAYRVQGGLYTNAPHIVSDVYGAYDNGRKDNDNTAGNTNGHDRYLAGFVAYKFGNTFTGAGARWSQLSTTNYTKSATHYQFGIGHDWAVARGQVFYILPAGTSGIQGPEFSVILPSPVSRRHLFVRFETGIYEYHDTVTDPSNSELTAVQTGNRHATASTTMMLMYRF